MLQEQTPDGFNYVWTVLALLWADRDEAASALLEPGHGRCPRERLGDGARECLDRPVASTCSGGRWPRPRRQRGS